jgi:Kdo2-lipid IVA lauroyltransferase/acyltransferase
MAPIAEESHAPPWQWLFGNAAQRRAAWRYWIRDTAVGGIELVLYRIFQHAPIDFCSWFGGVIVHGTRHLYPESEKRARKNWVVLRPQETEPGSVDAAMNRLWQCVSRTMAEFAVLHRLWAGGRIAVEGEQHLAQARAQGKPILLAALHLGNWEVIEAAGFARGYVGSSIYEPPENRFEHRIAVEVRARFGAKSIAAGPTTGDSSVAAGASAARAVLRALEEWGGPFVIFVDELIRNRVQGPAFGRPLRTDGNMAYIVRLAAMCDAVVIPIYCLRIGGGAQFKVTAMPALEMARSGDRRADVTANVARLNAAIEPIIRAHLDQWYYLLDFEFDS